MPAELLNAVDGLIQVWIKMLAKFEVWYFMPASSSCMLK